MKDTKTQRMLSLLDVIDSKGVINVKDMVREGHPIHMLRPYLVELENNGLVMKVARGVYGAGPRYRVQPAGTKFDPGSRKRMMAEMARQLLQSPAGGRGYPMTEVAKILHISTPTLRRLLVNF